MVRIGFADDNGAIRTVEKLLVADGLKPVIFSSTDAALEALKDGHIDCLVGGHDISTGDYLKKVFAILKPTNRVYAYSVLSKDGKSYYFADTAVNPSLTEEQVTQVETLLRGHIPDAHIVRLGFKTDDKTMQVDAALFPAVAEKKGVANAREAEGFIFPDLNAANIAYKLVQHLGKYGHVGPIIVGTDYFISDLSRGASVEEIYNTAVYLASLKERSSA